MTPSAKKHPVELLRDGKGIYGIGVASEAEIDRRPRDLILRDDRLPGLRNELQRLSHFADDYWRLSPRNVLPHGGRTPPSGDPS